MMTRDPGAGRLLLRVRYDDVRANRWLIKQIIINYRSSWLTLYAGMVRGTLLASELLASGLFDFFLVGTVFFSHNNSSGTVFSAF